MSPDLLMATPLGMLKGLPFWPRFETVGEHRPRSPSCWSISPLGECLVTTWNCVSVSQTESSDAMKIPCGSLNSHSPHDEMKSPRWEKMTIGCRARLNTKTRSFESTATSEQRPSDQPSGIFGHEASSSYRKSPSPTFGMSFSFPLAGAVSYVRPTFISPSNAPTKTRLTVRLAPISVNLVSEDPG